MLTLTFLALIAAVTPEREWESWRGKERGIGRSEEYERIAGISFSLKKLEKSRVKVNVTVKISLIFCFFPIFRFDITP